LVASGIISATTALMVGVVVLVLLSASANVANLMLARAAGRAKEIAIRIATGASRRRLVRQLLTESILLSLAGGALGIVLALWFSDALQGFYPSLDFQTADLDYESRFDPRILLFTFLLSLGTAVLFGLIPALRSSQVDQTSAIKGASTGLQIGRARIGGGNVLVMAQVALSCVLPISGGLFLRSMQFAHGISPGFDRSGITMFSINLDLQGYDAAKGRLFQRSLMDRLRALPAVESATVAFPLPLDAYDNSSTVVPDGYMPRSESEQNIAGFSRVGPHYFETMGTRLIAGRPIDERDTDSAPRIAIVNETMAQRYWQTTARAIGRKFATRRGGPRIEVIGVAQNGKYMTFGEGATSYYFVPLAQNYQGLTKVLVRSPRSPESLLAAIRQEVRALDPALPIFGVRTMPQFLNRTASIYEDGSFAGRNLRGNGAAARTHRYLRRVALYRRQAQA
jgi:predicted permease